MEQEFQPVEAKSLLSEIESHPGLSERLRAAIERAKSEAGHRGLDITGKREPVLASGEDDKCGGCFTCLACGATPTPDLEAACLVTAIYAG